jgi:hypothetical protein
MRSQLPIPAVTMFLMFLSTHQIAFGDHIGGHHESDPVFPLVIPNVDGAAIHASLIGPLEGTIITHTRFDVHLTTDGQMNGSELLMELSIPVDDDFRSLTVTGSDLGFGDGPGPYHGILETDYFNGVVWKLPIFPRSMPSIAIQSTEGGIPGDIDLGGSFIYLDVINVPEPATAGLLAISMTVIGLAKHSRRRFCIG